jgi:hypothetical protein
VGFQGCVQTGSEPAVPQALESRVPKPQQPRSQWHDNAKAFTGAMRTWWYWPQAAIVLQVCATALEPPLSRCAARAAAVAACLWPALPSSLRTAFTPQPPTPLTTNQATSGGAAGDAPSQPERDGGPTASTSGPGPEQPQQQKQQQQPQLKLKLRMRRPVPQDWLLLLDDSPLPRSLSKDAPSDEAASPPRSAGSTAKASNGSGEGRGAAAAASSTAPSPPSSSSSSSRRSDSPLRSAPSLPALLELVQSGIERQQPPFGADETMAALEAAVRLAQSSTAADGSSTSSGAAAATAAPPCQALDRLASLLLPRLLRHIEASALSPSDLAAAAYCCAKLKQRRAAGDISTAALAAAAALRPAALGAASPAELTRLAWALATLRAAPPPDWLDSLARAAQASFRTAQPVQLALTAWALARLGYRPGGAWVGALLEESEGRLAAAEPQALANITWALGVWR